MIEIVEIIYNLFAENPPCGKLAYYQNRLLSVESDFFDSLTEEQRQAYKKLTDIRDKHDVEVNLSLINYVISFYKQLLSY